jgi:hypothetical protein
LQIDLAQFFKQMDPLQQLQLLKQFHRLFILPTSKAKQGTMSKGNIMREVDKWVDFSKTLIAASKSSQFAPLMNSTIIPDTQTSLLDLANFTRKHSVYFLNCSDDLPIMIDSRATLSLSPNQSDFITKLWPALTTKLNGLSSTMAVEGFSTVEWTIHDLFGTMQTICTQAYYVPQATICLFSPQAYFQETNAGLFNDGLMLGSDACQWFQIGVSI